MKEKKVSRIILYLVFVTIAGFGAALTIKMAIGMGPWDALGKTMSNITSIKVGTMGIILNSTCVLLQILIEKSKFRPYKLLQVPVAFINGYIINFFYYNILGELAIGCYFVKLIVFILGMIVLAFAISGIVVSDVIMFPLESLCSVISDRTGKLFHKIRQKVDVISIVLTFLLIFLTKSEYTLREGTIISMLIFGPLMGVFMPLIKSQITKYGLLEEEYEK